MITVVLACRLSKDLFVAHLHFVGTQIIKICLRPDWGSEGLPDLTG